MPVRIDLVERAAKEVLVLAALSLPKRRSVDLVGDKLSLTRAERAAVERLVRWPEEVALAASKLTPPSLASGRSIGVDGYNVLITVETMLLGEPVFLCTDGLLRDLRGVFSSYRPSDVTERAMELIVDALSGLSPAEVLLAFDEPMSRSGELAAMAREKMSEAGLTGTSVTHRQVDTLISGFEIAASSDVAVIERARAVIDLPALVADSIGYRPNVIW
ncbi:MAG TPA: hypothetical protein ENF83_02940 [Candidatus Korarchaeota archaeon]|nr:hypothetical protein [Candidatus Korarchaeota archaeon]